MNIEVRFFASLQERVGTDRLALELGAGQGITELMECLRADLGAGAHAALEAENVRIAVNHALVTPPFALADGDEVAFLPPVTGG
jgi:molybdopterin converting factor subunit 1